jgi:hypothetical protein
MPDATDEGAACGNGGLGTATFSGLGLPQINLAAVVAEFGHFGRNLAADGAPAPSLIAAATTG